MLTQDQLKSNIDAMKQQGASDADIQGYLDSLKVQQTQFDNSDSTLAIAPPSSGGSLFSNPTQKLGEGLVGVMTQPYIRNLTTESQKGLNKTEKLLREQLRKATQKGDTKTINRIVKLLSQKNPVSPIETIARELPTNKEVVGSALNTLGTVAAFGTYGPAARGMTALSSKIPFNRLLTSWGGKTAPILNTLPAIGSRVGAMTVAGGATGAGSALEQNKGLGETVKSGLIGAGTGLVVSGALEALGALSRAIAGTKVIKKEAGKVYTSELQPPKKENLKSIEYGFKTFGEQASEVTDANGKPLYVGTYDTLKRKAEQDLSTKSPQLKNLLSDLPQPSIGRNEVAGDVVKQMEDVYGKLTPHQIKQIEFEVSKIPENFNLSQLEEIKIDIDGNIPNNVWEKVMITPDPAISFTSLVKYTLRDNARKLINEYADLAGDAASLVQKLNYDMGIAMDMRHLASEQINKRQYWKIGEGGYAWKIIGKFIDDYILNPAITTRYAQGLRGLGVNTGQQFPRQLSRLGLTEGITRSLTNQSNE